jgi:hypothetical protein
MVMARPRGVYPHRDPSSFPVAFLLSFDDARKEKSLVTCLLAGWTDSTPDFCGTDVNSCRPPTNTQPMVPMVVAVVPFRASTEGLPADISPDIGQYRCCRAVWSGTK